MGTYLIRDAYVERRTIDALERAACELAEIAATSECKATAQSPATDGLDQAPPATVGNEHGEVNGIPKLPDKCYLSLKALLLENAVSPNRSMTAVEIAIKAEGKAANPESFKRPLSTLKKHGYTDSKKGADGGCWLTVKGIELAKKL